MTKSRLIFDITQLLHWQGEVTGIPRVMDEVSKRYAKDEQVIFVTWDRQSKSYLQIDFIKTRTIRGLGICYIKKDGSIHNPLGSNQSSTTKPLLLAKKAYQKLHRKALHTSPFRSIAPGKDDILLVMWGEWHDPTFMDALEKAKSNSAGLVQIAYDMLPLLAPQYSGASNSTVTMANYNKRILPICDLILSISQQTKVDLELWLKANKLAVPPVKVIKIGDNLSVAGTKVPHEVAFEKSGLKNNGQFILCVGTVEARKNHALLYYVWKLAASKGIALPKIVIVGRRGWRTENIYDIITQDPATKDTFIFLHEASDEELSWLYAKCLFTVYPSFYEGWGLPISESIRYNVPVVSSNTSSMPEIAGDLINYFNPYSAEECLDAILNLMKPQEREKAKRLLLEYQPASWDDTYDQIKTYIKETYGKN